MTKFKVKDLAPKTTDIDIIVRIIAKGQPRMVKTKYGYSRVANLTVADETGATALTLWGKKISDVNFGDIIKIEDGYCGEWQGRPQLTLGRNGKMEIIEDPDFPDAQALLEIFKEQNV
ncbi:MAG: DNA-binding protein [Candidatus Heimdallarchaeota archaeon]|nr:DNA-binding protein [Candidatus Heimdallarchaeota archaeon]